MPILYSFRRCPYAMRARMALIRAGWELELREVVLRERPSQMLAVSAKGTVPVLVLDDGEIVDESLAIMRHVLAWQLDVTEAQWIARNDGEFKFHLDHYKYANRYEDVAPLEHRAAASGYLDDLNSFLGSGPISPALSDALFPFVRQFANHDRAWFDAQPWPQLQTWLSGNLESEAFTRCMTKYAQWFEGDERVRFPSCGE